MMKFLKGSKAYGAFEYAVIIALIIVVAMIILNVVKGKATGSGNILDKALGTANMAAGGSPGGEVAAGITITYAGPFSYGYEKDLETAVNEYFTANVEVKDKNGNIRTDYVLDNISKVGGFIQVELSLDGETVVKQISFNNLCLATDADFSGTTDGTFKYVGTAKCVEIPSVIKGVNVTSYANMFENTDVEKVISTNPNIVNMTRMFYNSQAASLDLSNFDTSEVTNMSRMFNNSQATTLDLSSFNTLNVINMTYMFASSQVVSLDLSNFNISKVTNSGLAYMFQTPTTISVLVKDAVIQSRLNTYTNKGPSVTISAINNCPIATDSDFSGTTNGTFKYTGTIKCVEIPNVIKGVNVTSYQGMFENTGVEKVISNNSNIINMRNMFRDSKATTLDLSDIDILSISNSGITGMLNTTTTTNVLVKDAATQTKLTSYANKGTNVTISIK